MELVHAISARAGLVALGALVTAVIYAAAHAMLDEYVTLLAGAAGAYAGYAWVARGASRPLEDARVDDAYAWGLGALFGVLGMHTLVQGGLL